MKYLGTNTYYNVYRLPVRRFSSVSPNVEFIDLAEQQTISTKNRGRRRKMLRDQIAFHYVVNVYHVNSVCGKEDIKRYSEIPHVLLGNGSAFRAYPYCGHENACSLSWDYLVWARLYEDGKKTEEIKTPLIDSHPTNRTYIDIIAEGINYREESRRVRAIFKIIDGIMCELWWINGSIKEKRTLTVIENYKTFCEMSGPCIYTDQPIHPGKVHYGDWPFIYQFTHANLFHSNIVDVLNNIISKDPRLEYAMNLVSLRVLSPYINQSVMDKADLLNKMRFALCVTYMHHVGGKFIEGDLYFGDQSDKYGDNHFLYEANIFKEDYQSANLVHKGVY